MENRQMVLEFTQAMNQPIGYTIEKKRDELFKLRLTLINEEVMELAESMKQLWSRVYRENNKASYEQAKQNTLKEICDVMYVLEGFCVTYGWDSTEAFKRVHESNMTKLGVTRADGKIVKGEEYVAPDLSDLVKEYTWDEVDKDNGLVPVKEGV